MFWRFGFHNASAIDSLLDKEDVSLEAILDEDDLLQECKAQNTRLIDFFQRTDVLKRLLGYVTGQIEGHEERGRFKYPYVATEVLCSEIWSIVETCVNNAEELLAPFWETVLDKSPEDMKTEMVMASHFAKVNSVFLTKKPAEMLAFIQSQPNIVERLLHHVEAPSIVDLLVRIVQLDEQPGGSGVLEWLSSEQLMGRLIGLLSPAHSSDVHAVVSELIKGIISMAAPSPGAGLTDGLQNLPASNRFARELARRESIDTLVGYILYEFKEQPPTERCADDGQHSDHSNILGSDLPDVHSATSSVVHSISIIIELIRKNNSDYFEPYLFHTLRNRLIQVQQQLRGTDNAREILENAMQEMVDRMGVVHLGPLLEVMSERLPDFQRCLRQPRSSQGPVPTTVGLIQPLTFERYRICELYAELLHCSNMALLNRSSEHSYLYDSQGRLQGGLSSLEQLARVIAIGSGDEAEQENDGPRDEVEPALELPIHNPRSSSMLDSDDDMSDEPGSSDDDAMEEIVMDDMATKDPPVETSEASMESPSISSSSPITISSTPPDQVAPQRSPASEGSVSNSPVSRAYSNHSRRSSKRTTRDLVSEMPTGEMMKQVFLHESVLSVLLDLFFEFPWNNFLHSVVYDFIHQVLTGRVDGGLNRELTIALFRDARLMHRIVEGQKKNDAERQALSSCVKPKGVRLGYMGHLTLLSEDVITALEHYPPELRLTIARCAPQPDWSEYVTGRYNETKKRDTSLLGGGKPNVNAPRPVARWAVDEEDAKSMSTAPTTTNGNSMLKGEFRRAVAAKPSRGTSADFGPAPIEEDEDDHGAGPPQFARYLAQEMHSEFFPSDASDDEDDDDGGWLAHSTFDLGKPPPARRHQNNTQMSTSSGFDDSFCGSSSGPLREALTDDPFGAHFDEDDAFGPFSDAAGTPTSEPIQFATSFSPLSSDDSFDFGEFHSADSDSMRDGELTPTAGSWTFASGSEVEGDSEGDEFGNLTNSVSDNILQTISLEEVNERIRNVRNGGWDS
ncbi:SIT4 phosphatase-associated protein-domain-containing protein [Pisolithus marmoratus]|nr:SIT4 phosphatase-associated protein-domain-containing protein [Pisolithus marmoratus]